MEEGEEEGEEGPWEPTKCRLKATEGTQKESILRLKEAPSSPRSECGIIPRRCQCTVRLISLSWELFLKFICRFLQEF